VRLTWVVEGKGGSTVEGDDIDELASALAAGLRDALSDLDTNTLAHVFGTVVAPLRASLVTDGVHAINQGQESWQTVHGGILVTLHRT
jgi:hypothetical protein